MVLFCVALFTKRLYWSTVPPLGLECSLILFGKKEFNFHKNNSIHRKKKKKKNLFFMIRRNGGQHHNHGELPPVRPTTTLATP